MINMTKLQAFRQAESDRGQLKAAAVAFEAAPFPDPEVLPHPAEVEDVIEQG